MRHLSISPPSTARQMTAPSPGAPFALTGALIGALALAMAAAWPAHAQTAAQGMTSPTTPAPTAPSTSAPGTYTIRTLRNLVAVCSTGENNADRPSATGLCGGYMSGVLDFYLAEWHYRHQHLKVCMPDPAPSRQEVIPEFISWSSAHDAYLDEPAVNGVMRFLITTFPCGKSGS